MTSTLVDSNVLIDVLKMEPPWWDWSRLRLVEAANAGDVVINQIVLAESAMRFHDSEAFAALDIAEFTRENLPWEASFRAGQAHRAYRDRGGLRERTLPDFLIGAHAEAKGHRLLTRDPRRYRAYFPTIDVIAPDTHP